MIRLVIAIVLFASTAFAGQVHFSIPLAAIEHLDKDSHVVAVDKYYEIPSDDEVWKVLMDLDYRRFVGEISDCDDFVFEAKGKLAFRGWPVAFVSTDGHYMLGWYSDKWHYIDPQTLEERKPPVKIYLFLF